MESSNMIERCKNLVNGKLMIPRIGDRDLPGSNPMLWFKDNFTNYTEYSDLPALSRSRAASYRTFLIEVKGFPPLSELSSDNKIAAIYALYRKQRTLI